MIRILIVADSSAIRDGLSSLLALASDFQVVGTANDGQKAIVKSEDLKPGVIIMDAQMPNMDGLEATRHIKNADSIVGILCLSVFTDCMEPALDSGADWFLPKDCDLEDLFSKIRYVAAKAEATRRLNNKVNSTSP